MKPGTPGFRGARLREAREARAISAVSLADLVGVTRAAISQYEHDKQTPSPAVLHAIADRLNFPIPYFLGPVHETPPGAVFYRSFTSATKTARLRAQRRYEWVRRIVAVLRRLVKFPTFTFPTVELPAAWQDLTADDIEDAATAVRSLIDVSVQPLSNVILLFERIGILAVRHGLDSSSLDAFSNWPPGDLNPFIVLGADKASAVRSRFDAAHEVGHMILHRHVPERDLKNRDALKIIEGQANRFAGALLLPREGFAKDVGSPTLDRFLVLKTTWGASVGAMISRCAQLSMLTPEREQKLWMNYARRGWKKREPYDDVIPPEEPHFIKRSLEVVLEKGAITREQLLHYVSLYPRDVEEVVGLPSGFLATGPTAKDRDIVTLPFHQSVIPF
jgi:Zn-dependent peptidase ImmA (M78 family)/transcriptional regulator with XRE-family HTH domain